MVANTWYYFEFKVVFGAGTSGSYAVRRNGAVIPGIPDVAATNTTATANAYTNSVQLCQLGNAGGTGIQQFDDMYLLTTLGTRLNDFLGDCRVVTLLPNAAGTNTNMTKVGAGVTNWQSVNEAQSDGDTTYVQSSVVGQLDTYKYASLPNATSSVLAVTARPAVRKDDAGSRSLTTHVRSNAVEADAPGSIVLATTYTLAGQIMEVNPVSGALWTVSDVNTAEFGPKVLS